jgi:hypothetical protein
LYSGPWDCQSAEDLDISGACIYNWRKQDRIDRGELRDSPVPSALSLQRNAEPSSR